MGVLGTHTQEEKRTWTTGRSGLASSINLVLAQEVSARIGFNRDDFAIVFRLDLRGDLLGIRLLRSSGETLDVGLT